MILKEFKRKITIAHSTRKCPRPKIIILRLRVVQSYMKQMVKEMPWMKKKLWLLHQKRQNMEPKIVI